MKLHNDVGVAFAGFLLLNDELPHSSTTNWLLERKSRKVWSLEGHKARITKFFWLEGFRFRNNICCNILSTLWKFIVNLVELAFKMLGILISKSPPFVFGDNGSKFWLEGSFASFKYNCPRGSLFGLETLMWMQCCHYAFSLKIILLANWLLLVFLTKVLGLGTIIVGGEWDVDLPFIFGFIVHG